MRLRFGVLAGVSLVLPTAVCREVVARCTNLLETDLSYEESSTE